MSFEQNKNTVGDGSDASKSKLKRLGIRLRYYRHKYMTPRNKLFYRSFVVFVLTIVNIVLMCTNLKKGKKDMAVACAVITLTLLPCLGIMLKVGHRSLAEKVRAWEEARKGLGNADATPKSTSGDVAVDYLSTNREESAAAASGSTKAATSSSPQPSSLAYSTNTSDPEHPASSCFFRRHAEGLIYVFLLFFFCSLSVGVYYFALGVEIGIVPTMTNLEQTFFMCFILYMFCGKWCFMIVLLMRSVRNEGLLFLSGNLLRVEAEQEAKRHEEMQEYIDMVSSEAKEEEKLIDSSSQPADV